MIVQGLSVVGAVLILAAYAASQRGWLAVRDRGFGLMNFVGAGLLTAVAWHEAQWGFVLLEGAWLILSVPPLLRGRG